MIKNLAFFGLGFITGFVSGVEVEARVMNTDSTSFYNKAYNLSKDKLEVTGNKIKNKINKITAPVDDNEFDDDLFEEEE